MSDFSLNSFSKAHGVAVGFLSSLLLLLAPAVDAQFVAGPTTRPLLTELNLETRDLFKQIASSIVRVQLPPPTSIAISSTDPLAKWADRLDPQSLARLIELQRRIPAAPFATEEIRPTTAPSSSADTIGRQVIVLKLDRISPNGIGIVVDNGNHLLIPRYVDKAACPNPIPVIIGDGRLATASFVASDRLSNLTLLQLNHAKVVPASVSAARPAAGTLMLVMSLNPAANRLTVWEGWEPDVATLVNIDGTIAGFTSRGHFLSAAACQPVVAELIQHGFVRRALLGVVVDPVGADDSVRRVYPALGASPALRVEQVLPGSVAERAGLQPDDLILSLAGEPVGDGPAFAAAIANRCGMTQIALLRDGQTHIVNVNLQVQ